MKSVDERFWSKVERNGPIPKARQELGPCWLWIASLRDNGYGQFNAGDNRNVRAHRFAYELLIGPIHRGREPDHLCRNRACCNPAHLDVVTRRENLQRSALTIPHQNKAKRRCPRCGSRFRRIRGRYKGRSYRRRVCRTCENARQRRRYHSHKRS